jgi:hypothetical protein
LSDGTGIATSGTYPNFTITNTAPDQIVALTAGTNISITGTYPNFTINATGGSGTVTSVAASGGTTGMSFSGSPITTSGTFTLNGTLAVASGGTGATSAATALTNLGAYPASNPSGFTSNVGTVTSVAASAGTGISVSGSPITSSGTLTITNTAPDQIVALTGAGTTSVTGTYPNFTITSNDQYVGTVTSVAASGGTTGLTFTGSPITTSGTLTLGGTLAVANGGTGTTTQFTTGSVVFAGASGVYSQDNANLFWDDTNNRLGIGTSSPVSPLHVEGGLATFQRYGSSGAIALRSAGGTQASPTAIASATSIGIVISRGYDGSAYRDIAAITTSSDGAISPSSSPGFIQFSTTPSGSVASTERMRITSAGNVGIATTTAPSPLTVAGTVESTTGGFKFPDGTTQTTAATGGGGSTGLQDVFMLMGA